MGEPAGVSQAEARRERNMQHKGKGMRVAIFALLGALCVLLPVASKAQVSEEVAEAIRDRIKPIGRVCVDGGDAADCAQAVEPLVTAVAVAPKGVGIGAEEVYNRYCFACHASGAAGAPRLGDSAAWAPRIAKGFALLLQNTIAGYGNGLMPARGLCNDCTDEELEEVLRYLVEASGG